MASMAMSQRPPGSAGSISTTPRSRITWRTSNRSANSRRKPAGWRSSQAAPPELRDDARRSLCSVSLETDDATAYPSVSERVHHVDSGGTEQHDEQGRQDENYHRDRQHGRQARRLLLRAGHPSRPHLGSKNAQRLSQRRAELGSLLQGID